MKVKRGRTMLTSRLQLLHSQCIELHNKEKLGILKCVGGEQYDPEKKKETSKKARRKA
jgi:hypothetical protein